MTESAIKLAVVILYFIVLMGLGLAAHRRIRSIEDFYVAGKKLGYWVVAFSARATGESAWLILGLTGMGFAIGINAYWVMLGELLGITCSWVFLAQRFKVLTDRYHSITVPDYLESRFSDKRHIIRVLSSIILIAMVTVYVAPQFDGTGKAFQGFFGWDKHVGILIGFVVIVFYTLLGGFTAVAWTDLLQGIMMCLGLIGLPILAVFELGGIGSLFRAAAAIQPDLLMVFGESGFTQAGVLTAIGFVTIGLGFMGSPQIYVRFISIRRSKDIVNGSIVAFLFTLLSDVGAITAGIAGRVLLGMLDDPETVFPLLADQLLPHVLSGVVLAVILAAIMSTADSLLILASSAFVRDVVQKIYHPRLSEKQYVLLGRVVTLILGLCALYFAWQGSELIFWFVLFAWSGIASAFCPVIILSLFWKRITLPGAVAGMVVGFVVSILWKQLGYSDAIIYEMVPAFFGALAVIILVSLFTKPPANAEEDLRAARQESLELF